MIKTRKEVGRKLEKRADGRFLGLRGCGKHVSGLSLPYPSLQGRARRASHSYPSEGDFFSETVTAVMRIKSYG